MTHRCYLVRHAETLWNRQNRLQGHSDLPLSPEGHAQARRLGGWFAQRRLGRLLSSGLQRSRQTASAILAGNGHRLSPLIDEDLAEMHLGAWEGLTPEEIDARFGGGYRQWRERPSTVVIPDAEPLEVFRARVRRAMERFARGPGEGEQVVVTHGGVIAMMLAEVLGADYDAVLRRMRLDNAGVTALEFWDGRPSVLWVNATEHLSLPAAGLP